MELNREFEILRKLPIGHALEISGFKIGPDENCSQTVIADAALKTDSKNAYVWAGHYFLALEEIEKLKKALEFYADIDNWTMHLEDTENSEAECNSFINLVDLELFNQGYDSEFLGGRLAREVLSDSK